MGENGVVLDPVLPLRPLWHMGALHPYEQALTLLLAFGPFLLLGLVLWWRRREDDRVESRDDSGQPETPTSSGSERLS